MSITGTLGVLRHHKRRVVYLSQNRAEYMTKARKMSEVQERRFWVRLARIVNHELVQSKRRINVLEGRRPTDDGIPQRPIRLQTELRLEG